MAFNSQKAFVVIMRRRSGKCNGDRGGRDRLGNHQILVPHQDQGFRIGLSRFGESVPSYELKALSKSGITFRINICVDVVRSMAP